MKKLMMMKMIMYVASGTSGADRHLDIGLQVVEAHPLFPYFYRSV